MKKILLCIVLVCNGFILQAASAAKNTQNVKSSCELKAACASTTTTGKKIVRAKIIFMDQARKDIDQILVVVLGKKDPISYKKALSAHKDPVTRAQIYGQVLITVQKLKDPIMLETYLVDLQARITKEFPKSSDQKISAFLKDQLKKAKEEFEKNKAQLIKAAHAQTN